MQHEQFRRTLRFYMNIMPVHDVVVRLTFHVGASTDLNTSKCSHASLHPGVARNLWPAKFMTMTDLHMRTRCAWLTSGQKFRNIRDCWTVITRVFVYRCKYLCFITFDLKISMDSSTCTSAGCPSVTSVKDQAKSCKYKVCVTLISLSIGCLYNCCIRAKQ